eukprot:Nk52_evm108s226 gene=Nk52_evmTU108s226
MEGEDLPPRPKTSCEQNHHRNKSESTPLTLMPQHRINTWVQRKNNNNYGLPPSPPPRPHSSMHARNVSQHPEDIVDYSTGADPSLVSGSAPQPDQPIDSMQYSSKDEQLRKTFIKKGSCVFSKASGCCSNKADRQLHRLKERLLMRCRSSGMLLQDDDDDDCDERIGAGLKIQEGKGKKASMQITDEDLYFLDQISERLKSWDVERRVLSSKIEEGHLMLIALKYKIEGLPTKEDSEIIDGVFHERSLHKGEIDLLREETVTFTQAMEEITMKNFTLKRELKATTDEFKAIKIKIHNAIENINDNFDKRATYILEVRDLDSKMGSLEKEIKELDGQMAETEKLKAEEGENERQKLNGMEEELAKLEEELNTIRVSGNEMKANIEKFTHQADGFRKSYDLIKKETTVLEQEKATLEKQIDLLTDEVKSEKDAIQFLLSKNKAVTDEEKIRVEKADLRLEELKQILEGKQKELAQVADESKNINSTVIRVKEELYTEQKTLKQLETDISNLKTRLKKTEQEIIQKQQTALEAKERNASIGLEVVDIKENCQGLEREFEVMLQEIQKEVDVVTEQREHLDIIFKEKKVEQNQYKAYVMEQLQEGTEQAHQQEEEKSAIKEDIRKERDQRSRLKKEIAVLEKKIKGEQDLSKEDEELEDITESGTKAVEQLTLQFKDNETQIEKLLEKVEMLKKEDHTKKGQFQTFKEECEDVESRRMLIREQHAKQERMSSTIKKVVQKFDSDTIEVTENFQAQQKKDKKRQQWLKQEIEKNQAIVRTLIKENHDLDQMVLKRAEEQHYASHSIDLTKRKSKAMTETIEEKVTLLKEEIAIRQEQQKQFSSHTEEKLAVINSVNEHSKENFSGLRRFDAKLQKELSHINIFLKNMLEDNIHK